MTRYKLLRSHSCDKRPSLTLAALHHKSGDHHHQYRRAKCTGVCGRKLATQAASAGWYTCTRSGPVKTSHRALRIA
eukprot:360251-Amphidinium_carterae.1